MQLHYSPCATNQQCTYGSVVMGQSHVVWLLGGKEQVYSGVSWLWVWGGTRNVVLA